MIFPSRLIMCIAVMCKDKYSLLGCFGLYTPETNIVLKVLIRTNFPYTTVLFVRFWGLKMMMDIDAHCLIWLQVSRGQKGYQVLQDTYEVFG